MLQKEKEVYDLLNKLEIKFQTYEHEPFFTVEQALSGNKDIPGAGIKNLFLKDNNKKFWLIVALYDTKVELKNLSKQLDAPGLRFAQADLLENILGVTPGSVTPLALINDKNHEVNVILDSEIFKHELIGIHPLRNSATTILNPNDLLKFINNLTNKVQKYSF